MTELDKIFQAEKEVEAPEHKGNEGWVTVAVGIDGTVTVIDYDCSFGAFCYMLDSVGGDNAEELGLDSLPENPGVYRSNFKVWTQQIPEYDIGFNQVGEWKTLWGPKLENV